MNIKPHVLKILIETQIVNMNKRLSLNIGRIERRSDYRTLLLTIKYNGCINPDIQISNLSSLC